MKKFIASILFVRSNGDKRVRVTTCKRGYKPTDPYSECTFVILNIKN